MFQQISSGFYSFWFGISLPYRSFKLIASKPKLIFWSLLPLLITLSLYVVLISRLHLGVETLVMQWLQNRHFNPEGIFGKIIIILTETLIVIISALTFSFTSAIVACPLNDFLAEQTEAYCNPKLPLAPAPTWSSRIKIILLDLFKSLAAFGVTVCAFLLSWVPVINVAAAFLIFLNISFQYISFPQSRRKQGVLIGIKFIQNHLFSCLGFGMGFTFLFSIPIVSAFCIPLAVVSGTLLVSRAQSLAPLPRLR